MLLRQALRSLRKSPGYTAACVAVLALGIGANTAIFSLVYDAILKPLSYPDADRLVLVYGSFPALPEPMASRMPANRLAYQEWQRQTTSFEGLAAFHENTYRESGVDRPRLVATELVAANFLPLLGARARNGRLFNADEEKPGADRVAVISDKYFEQRFKRDPGAIGQSIAFAGASYTVIGVLASDFQLPATFGGENQGRPDVFIPLSRSWTRADLDRQPMLNVAAKLRPGVTIDQARAEIQTITTRLHQSDGERFPFNAGHVYSFSSEHQSEDLNEALLLLLGAVGLVLLTGCANLANLTLARASRRSREIAVRRALGASRTDIVRQLLMESAVVSAAGALVGVVIAKWLTQGLVAMAPSDAVRPGMGELSVPVFLFAAAIAALTVLVFGLAPAVTVSATDLNTALKSGDRGGSAQGQRSRRFLIAAEVAMALVLITGAGLLLRSFANVVSTDLGIRTDHLLAVDLDLPEVEYPDAAARGRLLEEILEKARTMRGVTQAAIGDALPLHRVSVTGFTIVGRPPLPPGEFITSDYARILPGYLEILAVPVIAGRGLATSDVAASRGTGEASMLVNRAFVDKFLPSEDPLQQRLVVDGRTYQIVGITANFRALGAEEEVRPQFFRPDVDGESAILIVSTPGQFEAVSTDIRAMLGSLDERLSTSRIQTMEHFVDDWLKIRWFGLVLIGVFAGLALLLAMLGVYSVLAQVVASRTREIGIRMALGATPVAIGRLMASQSLQPVAFGIAAGVLASAALGRVIRSMLFQVQLYDPLTFALAIAGVLIATPLAIGWPIRRATRVECTIALREE